RSKDGKIEALDTDRGIVKVGPNFQSLSPEEAIAHTIGDHPDGTAPDLTKVTKRSNIEGEAAHRTALNKAIDDLAHGRPVDVEGIVTPEQAAYIEAWHGSPHDFDQFSLAHLSTGEGAQAYGHGL